MMKIKIPCSTSNLGPGFDTLGLALNRYLFLDVILSDLPAGGQAGAKNPKIDSSVAALPQNDNMKAVITVEGNGKEHIATDGTNLVYSAMCTTAKKLCKELPAFQLHLKNEIPAYGGLGGSGAAIAGGVFLANELLKGNLSKDEMLNIAVEIEGHPDNVSAALFGGLTINCFNHDRKVHCRSIKIEESLSVITCSPHFQVQTKQARKLLPEQISMKDAVKNIENTASLVAAMMSGDFDTLRYATEDRLHEKYRATLIPGYDEVKKAALGAGALSFNISGAGPTVFAFAVKNEKEIADAMVKAFQTNRQKSTAEIMKIENSGAMVI
ncbi:MAG: homoserine kinase [Bacteroidota bacterium]|nr:homoserine kinase [Bacteroidota bacterium]